jgi:hypothetical protein
VASALALFYPLPLSKFQLRPIEPVVIIQGNSFLTTNAPTYTETQTFADLIFFKADLELENAIIKEIKKYDWNDNTAILIAECESGFNPEATNWNDAKITGYPSLGVFQLNRPYNKTYFDWKYNIQEAYALYLKRGFQPWSCYSQHLI